MGNHYILIFYLIFGDTMIQRLLLCVVLMTSQCMSALDDVQKNKTVSNAAQPLCNALSDNNPIVVNDFKNVIKTIKELNTDPNCLFALSDANAMNNNDTYSLLNLLLEKRHLSRVNNLIEEFGDDLIFSDEHAKKFKKSVLELQETVLSKSSHGSHKSKAEVLSLLNYLNNMNVGSKNTDLFLVIKNPQLAEVYRWMKNHTPMTNCSEVERAEKNYKKFMEVWHAYKEKYAHYSGPGKVRSSIELAALLMDIRNRWNIEEDFCNAPLVKFHKDSSHASSYFNEYLLPIFLALRWTVKNADAHKITKDLAPMKHITVSDTFNDIQEFEAEKYVEPIVPVEFENEEMNRYFKQESNNECFGFGKIGGILHPFSFPYYVEKDKDSEEYRLTTNPYRKDFHRYVDSERYLTGKRIGNMLTGKYQCNLDTE